MSKPSEKAMRLANMYSVDGSEFKLAREIDAFATEALSEHKRVLDECETTLQWILARSDAGTTQKQLVVDRLAAIAELKGPQE